MSPDDEKEQDDQPTAAGDAHHIEQVSGGVVAVGRGAVATAVYQGLTVEEVSDLVVQLKHKDQPKLWDGRIPYLGLTSFHESDAQFFFGRESLVQDLLDRVTEARFIVIAGPSSSTKSSVARAGLFHSLRQGKIDKSETWLLGSMQPKGDPLVQLALAVGRLAKSPAVGKAFQQDAQSNPLALHEQIEALLTDDPNQRCVLLVDQFQKTFTQTKDEEERAAFINQLTNAGQSQKGRSTILLSLRSDFVSHCARYPDLRALISHQFQLVGAMEPPDLAKAITLPALEVGTEIEATLVSRIMADMKGEPGALPLMSFALRDLFEEEKTKPGQFMDLTLREYLDRGGIESALERHANKVFDLFSAEQKLLARGIFSKLIEVGQGRADTRRTAEFAELVPAEANQEEVAIIVSQLAQEKVRLITTSGVDSDEQIEQGALPQSTVTIAHEKLIDAWPWLRQLVDDNREAIVLQNQISADAKAWSKAKDAGFLYSGGRLAQVEERLEVLNPSLDALSQQFIQASLEQRRQEIEEQEAQQRRELEQAQALAEVEQKRNALFSPRFNN